ncbi:bidirectional sugar transporter SWEET4-like [Asparagus officinalis]|uniref:bidirectional sugar transporter SWEET4-like n=1 Tax=Asparagus officinalis TaxID=4686 RepID=UPI00098E80FF|nr:bidirectional sugar transporter SWEET4-like [Asparagus officinalis]
MVSADMIRTCVGILGNVIALCLFLSPVPTFYRIVKKGSVEQFSAVPYLATLFNCMFWVVYGLPFVHPHSTLVLTINGSGMVIELAYVLLFIIYSQGSNRIRVLVMLAAEIAFVAIVAVLVVTFTHTVMMRSMIIGILCVFFGTLMYAAPLAVMKLVIQTKSVEFMPLFLSLASFFNGLCWTTYALIRFDLYITIPNGLGVLFAMAQLVLHLIYYKSTKEQIEARKRKAETGLSEVVIFGEANKVSNAPAQVNGHRSEA